MQRGSGATIPAGVLGVNSSVKLFLQGQPRPEWTVHSEKETGRLTIHIYGSPTTQPAETERANLRLGGGGLDRTEFLFQSARPREPKTHGQQIKGTAGSIRKASMAIGTVGVKIGDNVGQRTITTIVAIIINQKGQRLRRRARGGLVI